MLRMRGRWPGWSFPGLWGVVGPPLDVGRALGHSTTLLRCPAPAQASRRPPPWARQALGRPGFLELEPAFPAVAPTRLPMALPVAAAALAAGVPFQSLLPEHSCSLSQRRALCNSGPSPPFSGSLVSEAGEDKLVRWSKA